VATWLLAANNQCRNGNSEAIDRIKPSGDGLAAAQTFQVTVCKVWVKEGNRSPSCGLSRNANARDNALNSVKPNSRPQQQNTGFQTTAPLGVSTSTQCRAKRHSLK
jgi:hypothetical protein